MSRIKGKNTKPETRLRKMLWNSGVKGYRIHPKITGKPDLYFPKSKVAVFIDGCYWHKCPECFIEPKSNIEFWLNKINGNVERDKKVNNSLSERDITVLRLWEHEVKKNPEGSVEKIKHLLHSAR